MMRRLEAVGNHLVRLLQIVHHERKNRPGSHRLFGTVTSVSHGVQDILGGGPSSDAGNIEG
jgi:hypothetical protein